MTIRNAPRRTKRPHCKHSEGASGRSFPSNPHWKICTSFTTKNPNKVRNVRPSTFSPSGRQADSAPAFPPTAPRLPLRRPAVRRPTRSGRAPTTHLHKSSRIKPYPIHRDYPGASHYLFDENRTEAERWMTEALTSANSLALPKLERIARTHSLKIPG